MTLTRAIRLFLLLPALALASCDEPTTVDDTARDESELTFVPMAEDAPPLERTVARLTAVKGEESVVEIRYLHADGSTSRCLVFRVPANSLHQRPNGDPILPGESVEITITVVDPEQYYFQMEPSGLRFDPSAPAVLEIHHGYAADDLNGDGVVDAEDARISARVSLWRQEHPGERWTPVQLVTRLPNELRARLNGFTRYALAAD